MDYEGPKVDNSIFCHLAVEKQNKRFRTFLVAENEI